MNPPDVAIIDGGGANIASLQYAFDRIGARSVLTDDPATIQSASHVVLPGVGAASAAMQRIHAGELAEVIRALEQPVLGICLGMQLLSSHSEEGCAKCLDVFPSGAEKLRASQNIRVPNMGWCRTHYSKSHPLLEGIENGSWFYYVHSYALPVSSATVATAQHTDAFSAIESIRNFHAVQFHPERSSKAGSRLLQNFVATRA